MPTTENQKQRFQQVAEAIEDEAPEGAEGIEFAKPDDWGHFGNAQIVIALNYNETGRGMFELETNLRKLTPAIKRAVRRFTDVDLDFGWGRAIEHPEPQYDRNGDPVGRTRAYTMVHIRVL
jgi:hypothetical protein